MAEKILKSKICTKRGLLGYVNNFFKKIDKIYAIYDVGKLDLLSSYEDIIEDKLVKIMNLREQINDNIENEEEFQKELSPSFKFREQVKFQLKQLEKFIFANFYCQSNKFGQF